MEQRQQLGCAIWNVFMGQECRLAFLTPLVTEV
jgi:hypothetical protein